MRQVATPVELKQTQSFQGMRSRTYRKRPIELLAVSFEAPAPDDTPYRWIDGGLRQRHPLDEGVPIPGHAQSPPAECDGPCAVCDENQARKALETDTLGFRAALTQPTPSRDMRRAVEDGHYLAFPPEKGGE